MAVRGGLIIIRAFALKSWRCRPGVNTLSERNTARENGFQTVVMALRAQSTGPSCKLNNAALSTDMYRVSGQTQHLRRVHYATTTPPPRLVFPLLASPSTDPVAVSFPSSWRCPGALILFSLHGGSWYEQCLRVAADTDSRQLYSRYCTLLSLARNPTANIFPSIELFTSRSS